MGGLSRKKILEKKKGLVFMNIFDEVNSLPEAVIAQRLGLSTARDGKSFVCPECGNGTGKTGDGIKQTKLKGKLVWHCYRCGGHWSNVDLIGVTEGIREQGELGKKLEELFPESKPFLFSKENQDIYIKSLAIFDTIFCRSLILPHLHLMDIY